MSERGLYTFATGMRTAEIQLGVIANNMANIGTTAFAKSLARCEDLSYQTLISPGQSTGANSKNAVGQQIGIGTRVSAISKEFIPGSLVASDRELDIAISGEGFLQFTDDTGQNIYTRDGSLFFSEDRSLVSANGFRLAGIAPAPLNAVHINFSETGRVSCIDENNEEIDLGQINLNLFANPSGLSAIGGNFYRETPATGAAIPIQPGTLGAGVIKGKMIETSNVCAAEEMVKLMSNQRHYEFNAKGMKAADEMLATANQIGSR